MASKTGTQLERLLNFVTALKQKPDRQEAASPEEAQPPMKVVLTVRNDQRKEQVIAITEPDTIMFGRAKDAHVILPPTDHYASRNHFVLVVSPLECRLRDLDSANGTFISGVRYGGRTPMPAGTVAAPNDARERELVHGDVIHVGETTIEVNILRTSEKTTPKAALNSRSQPSPNVELPTLPPCGPGALGKFPPEPETVGLPMKSEGGEAWVKRYGAPCDLPGYRFESLIGEGRMGLVFRAVREDTGKALAVKVLASGNRQFSQELITALENELAHQARLNHPNIVKFLEVKRTEKPCLLFEYVDGPNLRTFLASKHERLSIREAAPLALDMLAGLAHAHANSERTPSGAVAAPLPAGLVHRDLKLENILLTRIDGLWRAKVTDFALIKIFESLGITGNTTSEVMAGSPAYWPREYITAYRYLYPPSDVFSAAAIMFRMLTGECARDGFSKLGAERRQRGVKTDVLEYVKVVMNERIRPLRAVLPDVPEGVAHVIDRALTERELPRDADRMRQQLGHLRYPDAGAFRAALLEAFRGVGIVRDER